MDWTMDTRIEVTAAAVSALAASAQRKAGRGYKPTGSGRREARPLLQARDAVLTAPAPRPLSDEEKAVYEEIAEEEDWRQHMAERAVREEEAGNPDNPFGYAHGYYT